MIQPKNETEDLLLSITKNCEILMEQTHKKAEETLEIEMTKPREKYHFKPPIPIQGSWMIGLTDLEVYNSLFIITEENNEFDFYTGYLYNEISYNQFKDKVAEIPGLPNIMSEELEKEKFGPKSIEIYRKLSMKKSQSDGYYFLLGNFLYSPYRDF